MSTLLNSHGEFESDMEPRLLKLRQGKPLPKPGEPRWRRTCPICQRNFWAESPHERYCSMGCEDMAALRRKAIRAGRTCPVCGGPVTGRKTRVYCSNNCSAKAQARRRTERERADGTWVPRFPVTAR